MLMPSVVTLMLPTQKPEWLMCVAPGLPSSVCSTYAGGAVMQPLLPRSTLSTTSMRGRSQPVDLAGADADDRHSRFDLVEVRRIRAALAAVMIDVHQVDAARG